MAAAHSHPQPDTQRAGSSSLGMANGSMKSLARHGSSPSRSSPTSHHLRNSSSASSLSLAPDFIASTARKDMTFLQPAAGARYIASVSIYVCLWLLLVVFAVMSARVPVATCPLHAVVRDSFSALTEHR